MTRQAALLAQCMGECLLPRCESSTAILRGSSVQNHISSVSHRRLAQYCSEQVDQFLLNYRIYIPMNVAARMNMGKSAEGTSKERRNVVVRPANATPV